MRAKLEGDSVVLNADTDEEQFFLEHLYSNGGILRSNGKRGFSPKNNGGMIDPDYLYSACSYITRNWRGKYK